MTNDILKKMKVCCWPKVASNDVKLRQMTSNYVKRRQIDNLSDILGSHKMSRCHIKQGKAQRAGLLGKAQRAGPPGNACHRMVVRSAQNVSRDLDQSDLNRAY